MERERKINFYIFDSFGKLFIVSLIYFNICYSQFIFKSFVKSKDEDIRNNVRYVPPAVVLERNCFI